MLIVLKNFLKVLNKFYNTTLSSCQYSDELAEIEDTIAK